MGPGALEQAPNWYVTVRPSALLVWTPLVTVYLGWTTAVVVAVPVFGVSPSAVRVAVLTAWAPLAVVKFGYLRTTVMVAVVPGASGLLILMVAVSPTAPAAGTVDPATSTVDGSGVQPTNSMPGASWSTIFALSHSVTEQV